MGPKKAKSTGKGQRDCAEQNILLGRNRRLPVHEWTQRVRNHDRAILLLIIFEDGDQRPSHGETRPIQRVHEVRLASACWTELDVGATRLECLRVTARRYFTIGVLAGKPHLDVVRLRRSESHVSGAQQYGSKRELEALEHGFRVAGKPLQLLV